MTLRSRILVLVLSASVVPLALVGLWLTSSAVRSGEQLLADRLDAAMAGTVSLVTTQWIQLRSALLFVAEDPEIQAVLSSDGSELATESDGRHGGLTGHLEALPAVVLGLELLNAEGARLEGVRRPDGGSGPSDLVGADLTFTPLETGIVVFERLRGSPIGTLRVRLAPSGLLPTNRLPAATAGMMVALIDSRGRSLLPLPLDLSAVDGPDFEWAGEEWVLARRQLEEPAVEIRIAATSGPFVGPFRRTARQGTLVLLSVAVVVLILSAVLTSRLTRSLRDLTLAAEAVSQGDLGRTVTPEGDDEVGRVARSFNRMTAHLRQTLDRLAGQESLAAVGEFSANLAHEVRNPLTAVQVDLQFVESQLPADSPLREPQAKALAEIRRLDATVRDTLKVARSGRVQPRPMDLRDPLSAAAEAATPAFDRRGTELSLELPGKPVSMTGDPHALEQLFLNLFRNAAEAMQPGGCTTVTLTHGPGECVARVMDEGTGMPAEVIAHAFEPLFSTRKEGTGLGLPIAQRIALAHGGSVRIESELGQGTTVEVRLPVEPVRTATPVRAP